MQKINSETQIYCSFSSNPGNFGTQFHNAGFELLNINALYKSFKSSNIKQSLEAMVALDIKGAGISAPFKIEVLKYCHELSQEVKDIGSANTILNDSGKLIAYNTDCLAIARALAKFPINHVNILGEGGYSKAVQYTLKQLGRTYSIINREQWYRLLYLRDSFVFNATPVKNIQVHESNIFVDCDVNTKTGKALASFQAAAQFELYTGLKYPYAI